MSQSKLLRRFRDRPVSAEEAAENDRVRAEVQREFPPRRWCPTCGHAYGDGRECRCRRMG